MEAAVMIGLAILVFFLGKAWAESAEKQKKDRVQRIRSNIIEFGYNDLGGVKFKELMDNLSDERIHNFLDRSKFILGYEDASYNTAFAIIEEFKGTCSFEDYFELKLRNK